MYSLVIAKRFVADVVFCKITEFRKNGTNKTYCGICYHSKIDSRPLASLPNDENRFHD